MNDDFEKLREDLLRYRYLLRGINDPRAIAVLQEMIAEIEARLQELHPPATAA